MSSKSPVPSRAALNALRGVLFTTSCSVFLLAEERRRRLNIARAAIENARKLHTVRSNRGAIALTSDVVDEIASPPLVERPLKNPHRRRRRDDLTNYILHDPNLEFHRHGTDCRKLELKIQEAQAAGGTNLEKGSGSSSSLPLPLGHDSGLKPLQFLAPALLRTHPRIRTSQDRKVAAQGGEGSEAAPTGSIHDLSCSASQPTEAPLLPKEVTLDMLRSLLSELGRTDDATAEARTKILKGAIAHLRQLIYRHPSTPSLDGIIHAESLEVLKHAFVLDRTQVPSILTSLCNNSKGWPRTLSLLMQWLEKRNDIEGFQETLDCLMQLRDWSDGMLLYRLLQARSKLPDDHNHTRSLYDMLRRAGLFDAITVPREIEYKIRRLMFTRAIGAGEDAFTMDEMRSMYKLDPDLTQRDVELQSMLILHEAGCGRWDAARTSLVALTEVADADTRSFRSLLVKITDMFAKAHTDDELEKLLRALAVHYKIPMKQRWVDRVLDGHASRRETGRMVSWLEFSSGHGLKVDDRFLESYMAKCRKYLSFSDATITKFYEALGRSEPIQLFPDQVKPPQPFPNQGKCQNEEDGRKGEEQQQQQQQQEESGHTLPAHLHSLRWASRADALEHMQALEAHGEWQRLIEAYAIFQRNDLGFSQDILRLAVLGCIKASDTSGMEQASTLVAEARGQGHDVSGALMPLLIARIERGDDPGGLLKSALQHGIKVHDSVYNKATQSAIARGDTEGAIQLCRLAARQNGGRRLLYSEHNFLNLVFAYMGTAQYGPLRNVVAGFTSRVDWWKGSQRCKMSIKLAMKTAAMRAAVNENPVGRKKHEDVLFKLDEALVHVRRCRVAVGERQAVRDALVKVVKGREEQPQEEEEMPWWKKQVEKKKKKNKSKKKEKPQQLDQGKEEEQQQEETKKLQQPDTAMEEEQQQQQQPQGHEEEKQQQEEDQDGGMEMEVTPPRELAANIAEER